MFNSPFKLLMYDDSERAGPTTVRQFVPRFFLSVALCAHAT